jgi:hypothetical protein
VSHSHADYQQVKFETVMCEDTDGTQVEVEAFVIPVIIPVSEVGELLASYDPSSGTSPGVTISRPLSRTILDALRRKVEE